MNAPFDAEIILRDLQWVCTAPSLLKNHPQIWPEQQFDFEQLAPRMTLTQLEALSNARQRKLGGYFEQLVFTLFTLSRNYKVLAFNQVINSTQRTLGELDLLIQNQSGEIIHLELALKFYLWAHTPQQSQFNWVGAGLTDFLALKLSRLANHQLQLAKIASDKNCWPNLPMPDRALLWIPGRLYLPSNTDLMSTSHTFTDSPWQLNPNALTAHWLITSNTDKYAERALIKGDWLTGYPSRPAAAMARYQLPMQFSDENHSPVFILPSNWQNNAETIITDKQNSHEASRN